MLLISAIFQFSFNEIQCTASSQVLLELLSFNSLLMRFLASYPGNYHELQYAFNSLLMRFFIFWRILCWRVCCLFQFSFNEIHLECDVNLFLAPSIFQFSFNEILKAYISPIYGGLSFSVFPISLLNNLS